MNAVTHLEKVITGEVSAVTHLEKVIAGETSAVTYTEKVITGEAPAVTHLQKVIAGKASPVTHLEYIWAGGSPTPTEHEYTGAVPVTFNADGEPLLDYLISGNMSQTGTPTPQNPIQPSETGERTGNLFDSSTIEVGGLSPTTGAETTDNARRRSGFISVEPSTNYGLSREITSSGSFFWVIAYDENKNIVTDATVSAQFSGVLVTGTALTINQWTFTTTPTTKYIRWYVTVDNSYKNIMLNTGSTALPYEPYGYKIPISSANTTTPVYLGKVQTERKIRKYEFTGQEDITLHTIATGNLFRITLPALRIQDQFTSTGICTHYRTVYRAADRVNGTISGGNVELVQSVVDIVDDYATIADFKSYLAAQYAAGTPVTVWYVLAEPTTGIVNEPFRKIGNYADTLSMEQAGVSIPTNNGSTTVDVDTTLKPSEVYIKYKGV